MNTIVLDPSHKTFEDYIMEDEKIKNILST